MLNCYSLKLPKLSDKLDKDLYEFSQTFNPDSGFDVINLQELNKDMQVWIEFHKQTNTSRTAYTKFDMPYRLQLRLAEEMTNELFPFSKVNFYFQLVSGGEKLIPHRDPGRTLSILYNISADNAITHFYKTSSNDPDQYLYSLEEVEEIESYQMEPYKWYSFNNACVHGVSNVFKNRIAITCQLNVQPELNLPDYRSFCEQYAHLLGPATTNRT